jgi:acid phosphatase class B
MLITVDFDHTLQFNDGSPNDTTLQMLRMNHKGDQIVIVTSRSFSVGSVKAIQDFAKQHNLNVSNIIHTNGSLKGPICKAVNSQRHFDDCEADLDSVKEQGVDIVNCFDAQAWSREVILHL